MKGRDREEREDGGGRMNENEDCGIKERGWEDVWGEDREVGEEWRVEGKGVCGRKGRGREGQGRGGGRREGEREVGEGWILLCLSAGYVRTEVLSAKSPAGQAPTPRVTCSPCMLPCQVAENSAILLKSSGKIFF